MRMRFYVDGLNFYYNVISKIPGSKWLDLERCLRITAEKHLRMDVEVEQIKLFTSIVRGDSHVRQKNYYDALQTHSPNIKIYLGEFSRGSKRGKLVTRCPKCKNGKLDIKCPQCGQDEIVKIRVYEEKQTDVNLATAMVEDAYTQANQFDLACLVSNDSDLLAALTILKKLKQRTLLLPPLVDEHSRYKSAAEALRNMLLNPDRDCIRGFAIGDVGECPLPVLVGGRFGVPGEWGG